MKKPLTLLILSSGWLLAACSSGMPQLFYPIEDAQKSAEIATKNSRAPLEVPPELRGEATVPIPENIARETEPERIRAKAVTGKAVSLDARIYEQGPGKVFSAVVDAMTSLNMPVDSVDSPSGVITTEWIRKDASTSTAYMNSVMNMFGSGKASHVRHRFVVRVLRMQKKATRLEIRTLGQAFMNKHWVNKKFKIKLTNDLFSAVEEQLTRSSSPPQ